MLCFWRRYCHINWKNSLLNWNITFFVWYRCVGVTECSTWPVFFFPSPCFVHLHTQKSNQLKSAGTTSREMLEPDYPHHCTNLWCMQKTLIIYVCWRTLAIVWSHSGIRPKWFSPSMHALSLSLPLSVCLSPTGLSVLMIGTKASFRAQHHK